MNFENQKNLRTDLGIVFSTAEEKNGLFDLLPKAENTVGNGLKYSISEYNGLTIAAVEAGTGKDNALKASESLYSVFHPSRIINAGFAHSLSPQLKKNTIFVPDRIISDQNERPVDFRSRALPSPVNNQKQDSSEEQLFQFFKGYTFDNLKSFPRLGTLCSVLSLPGSTEEKRDLQKSCGASCCDRIGFTVAQFFIAQGVPFLPVRIIISNADEAAKQTTEKMNDASSGAQLFGMMIGGLIKKPKSVLEFCGNKTDRIAASDKLGKTLLKLLAPADQDDSEL